MAKTTYILLDHICKGCSGRMLQNAQRGPSGDSLLNFRCSDCGEANRGSRIEDFCMCSRPSDFDGKEIFKCITLLEYVTQEGQWTKQRVKFTPSAMPEIISVRTY